MIKKKKVEEAQADAESLSQVNAKPVRSAKKVSTLPVYMQLFTVVLLFVAGLDIGLQQSSYEGANFQLAINEHGLPLIHRNVRIFGAKKEPLEELKVSQESYEQIEEEFADILKDEVADNIDPIFRVDLDKLTEGPGLLNQLARQAVSVHRLILFLVFYFPKNALQTFVGVPQALLQSPPALCVIAVIVRQVFGKAILGAGIPELDEKDDNGGVIDVVAMIKKFVSNFFAGNFPLLAKLYDAFTHLRADIYVMLFGVFSGLAWVHMMGIGDSYVEPETPADPALNEL